MRGIDVRGLNRVGKANLDDFKVASMELIGCVYSPY